MVLASVRTRASGKYEGRQHRYIRGLGTAGAVSLEGGRQVPHVSGASSSYGHLNQQRRAKHDMYLIQLYVCLRT
eukprot:6214467-Pleurochrysis_carterae.AAC.4